MFDFAHPKMMKRPSKFSEGNAPCVVVVVVVVGLLPTFRLVDDDRGNISRIMPTTCVISVSSSSSPPAEEPASSIALLCFILVICTTATTLLIRGETPVVHSQSQVTFAQINAETTTVYIGHSRTTLTSGTTTTSWTYE